MKLFKNWYVIIPVFILFFVASYYIYITSREVRFWADDFCSSILLRNNGYFKSQVIWWKGWTGRYSYIALLDFTELFGLSGAQVLPIILYVLFLLSSLLIFSFSVPVALFLSVIFLLNSPNIIQSFYWMTGSLNYFAPFIFLNFYLSLFFLKYKRYFPVVGFVLLLIATGFSESFGVANFMFLTFLCFVFSGREKNKILISGLLATILSLGIMYLSPGNSVRSSLVTHPAGILDLLTKTFYYSKWYLLHLVYIKPFVLSMMSILFGAFIFLDSKYKYFKFPKLIATQAIVFIIAITTIVIGFTYQAMNLEPPERVMTIVNYMILFAAIIFSIAIFQIFNKYIPKIYAKIVFSILVILLFFQVNYHWQIIYKELKVSAESPIYTAVGKLDGLDDNKGWVRSCIMEYYK